MIQHAPHRRWYLLVVISIVHTVVVGVLLRRHYIHPRRHQLFPIVDEGQIVRLGRRSARLGSWESRGRLALAALTTTFASRAMQRLWRGGDGGATAAAAGLGLVEGLEEAQSRLGRGLSFVSLLCMLLH